MHTTQILPRQRGGYAAQAALRAKRLEITRAWDFGQLGFNMTSRSLAVKGWAEKAEEVRDFAAMLMLIANAMEEIEHINHTPDRSGEADKTGAGLAEGESGLPEGSSKPCP